MMTATAPDPGPGAGATPSPGASTVAHPPPARRSVWTTRQKLVRVLWGTIGRIIWVLVPGARSALLRLFGGSVGANCSLPRSVQIFIPWNVHLGRDVRVGERTILYGLGPIRIGDGTVIDYRAHLCAGTHDMTDSRFPLIKPPITIGAGCYIGIDAYIGPDVTLGDGCRVWPRASVYRSFPAGTELIGNPAKAAPRGPGASGTGE